KASTGGVRAQRRRSQGALVHFGRDRNFARRRRGLRTAANAGRGLKGGRGEDAMIYANSLGRAARHFPDRAALWSGDRGLAFTELDQRVAGIAGALSRYGFGPGDRLAVLMPNGAD